MGSASRWQKLFICFCGLKLALAIEEIDKPLLSVRNLRVAFKTKKGAAYAVDDVSFDVYKGEVFGIAGESGSGKSTIGLSILRLIEEPGKIESGQIIFDGKNILDFDEQQLRDYRWRDVSMIFQGAMNAFNPVMRIGEQLVDVMLAHSNISEDDAYKRATELLELVGIDKVFINRYPFELSGGMKQRAMIAMSLALNPKLLIADEPTTSIDVIRQVEVLRLLKGLQTKLGLSMIYITHDLSIMAAVADRIGIMYAGKLIEQGTVEQIYVSPAHPYTRLLVESIPTLEGTQERLKGIPGQPPNPLSYPSGCRFHPRCPYAMNVCALRHPDLKPVGTKYPNEITPKRFVPSQLGHYAACYLWDKMDADPQDPKFTPLKPLKEEVNLG